MAKMPLKIEVNHFDFEYELRVFLDACLVQILRQVFILQKM